MPDVDLPSAMDVAASLLRHPRLRRFTADGLVQAATGLLAARRREAAEKFAEAAQLHAMREATRRFPQTLRSGQGGERSALSPLARVVIRGGPETPRFLRAAANAEQARDLARQAFRHPAGSKAHETLKAQARVRFDSAASTLRHLRKGTFPANLELAGERDTAIMTRLVLEAALDDAAPEQEIREAFKRIAEKIFREAVEASVAAARP